MDWATPVATLLVGAGVVRELWKMRAELSCIKGEFVSFRTNVQRTLDDHEDRLRVQEDRDA